MNHHYRAGTRVVLCRPFLAYNVDGATNEHVPADTAGTVTEEEDFLEIQVEHHKWVYPTSTSDFVIGGKWTEPK